MDLKSDGRNLELPNLDGAHAAAAAFLIRLMIIFMEADVHQ